MTGCYPHQVGLTFNGKSLGKNAVTIAEVLRGAGYHTAMTGKWHLSQTLVAPKQHLKWLNHQVAFDRPFGPLESYPVNRGFEKFYGVIWGVIDFFDPFSLVEGDKAVDAVPADYYFTDAITDKSVQYIKEYANSQKPFFLYVSHCAPHWPLHARPEDIAKYKDTYQGGWHKLRQDRFRRQLEMGLFSKDTAVLPPVMGPAWDEMDEKAQQYAAAKMAVHAAMVDRVDQGIGRLVEALKATGQFDNTVIFFLSDNGASPEIPSWPPGYDRPSETRDGRKMLRTKDLRNRPELLGSQESYEGIGPGWANASCTPFRYWKKESYEGGSHTPMIVHWPAGLKLKPGSFTDQVGHVMDVMPTCLDLAGAEYPARYDGNNITPCAGKSLIEVLQGKQRRGHEYLAFEHEGGRALRMGAWKISALRNQPFQLFDLSKDRTEMHNVSKTYPQKHEQLKKLWFEWADAVGLKRRRQGDPR